jgi:hypothetical protein
MRDARARERVAAAVVSGALSWALGALLLFACSGLKSGDEVPPLASDAATIDDVRADEPRGDDENANDADAASDVESSADVDSSCVVDGGCGCASGSDVHVSASAAPGGNGSATCPFKTITAGLAASSDGSTLHVHAGAYDATIGEVFPLVLRGGRWLKGDSAASVVVRGVGVVVRTADTGPLHDNVFVTILGGDANAPVRVSGLTLEWPGAVDQNTHGILCDRGNAVEATTPPPAPSLVLDSMVVRGSGYSTGVIAASSAVPSRSGCNLRVTATSFEQLEHGVWGVGDASGPGLPVNVAIGNGTATGASTFRQIANPQAVGNGVLVWDMVTHMRIDHAVFEDSEAGIGAVQHVVGASFVPNDLAVRDCTFQRLTAYGISIEGAMVLAELSNSTFTSITATAGASAMALRIQLANIPSPYSPRVARARGNVFLGNDAAIVLDGTLTYSSSPKVTPTDFGRSGDPGGNVFRCNSAPTSSGLRGFDVVIGVPSDGAASMTFAGNQWDRVPPSSADAASAANGTELAFGASPRIAIDVSGATAAASACPADRAP